MNETMLGPARALTGTVLAGTELGGTLVDVEVVVAIDVVGAGFDAVVDVGDGWLDEWLLLQAAPSVTAASIIVVIGTDEASRGRRMR